MWHFGIKGGWQVAGGLVFMLACVGCGGNEEPAAKEEERERPAATDRPVGEQPIAPTPTATEEVIPATEIVGSWDGRRGEWGKVEITGGPREFTGTYTATYNGELGSISFQLEGNTLRGTYRETDNQRSGTLELKLADAGQKVQVTYTRNGSTSLSHSLWKRTTPTPTVANTQPTPPPPTQPTTPPPSNPPSTPTTPPPTASQMKETPVSPLPHQALAEQGWTDLPGGGKVVQSVSFSPDGKRVAMLNKDGQLRIWDLAAGLMRRFETTCDYRVVRFMDDGISLAVCLYVRDEKGNQVHRTVLIDAETGKPLSAEMDGRLDEASPTGTAVLEEKNGYERSIWNLKTATRVMPFPVIQGGSKYMISPDGKTIALYFKKTVRLFDAAAGKERDGIPELFGNLHGLAFSPDSTRLVCCTDQTSTSLWDVSDPTRRPRILLESKIYTNFAPHYSADGSVVVLRGDSSKMILVDARTLQQRAEVTATMPLFVQKSGGLVAPTHDNQLVLADLNGNTLSIIPTRAEKLDWRQATLSPDGTLLALPLNNGDLRLLQLVPPNSGPTVKAQLLAELPHPKFEEEYTTLFDESNRYVLNFSPDGKYLLGHRDQAYSGGRYAVWDASSGQGLASGWGAGLTLLPDGKTLYSQEFNGRVFFERHSDLTTGRWQLSKNPIGNSVDLLPFDQMSLVPGGKSVLAIKRGHSGNPPQLVLMPNIDLQTAEVVATLGIGGVHRFCFSPDGKLFALNQDRVHLFDLVEKVERPTMARHANYYLGFTDDGRALGTAELGSPDTVRIYDIDSGQLLKEINARQGHAAQISAVAISPAGRLFATCDKDGTVVVKNWETGQELTRLKSHTTKIICANFSPDGTRLATAIASKDKGFVKLWSLLKSP